MLGMTPRPLFHQEALLSLSHLWRMPWLWLSVSAVAAEPAVPPSNLVATQQGSLPIILSAPHGGTHEVPGVTSRKGEGLARNGKGFAISRDTGTEELTYALADAIEKHLGKKPYFIVAKFHRKYIDA